MKLYLRFGWFFIDIFGLMCSFGLGSFVERDMVSLHDWDLVQCPGKSMAESSNGAKVSQHVKNVEFLDRETFPGPRRPLRDPKSRADAQ